LKIKNFIKQHKEYFITSAIVFAIVFSFYAIYGLFPFGKNSIAYYDMAAQTIPQSDLIFDYLKGRTSWFYSTSTGMGANTFGYIIYFILSPFNLLTLIAGEANQFFVVNIVFLLKLICIGCMAVWFIKKNFKNVNAPIIIALSLLYVFSGYTLFMWTYLSFLDYLIYAPLFVYLFDLLKNNKGKVLPMGILIAFMILSCFSLGCFHLLYLVGILIGYVFICVERQDRKVLFMKLISACFIGIGFTMWLLFPALIQYVSSSRGSNNLIFTEYIFYGTSSRIGVVLTEIISVFFATIFLIKCDKKDKFNKFLIYTSILILLTVIFDEIMYMLNAGSVLGYYSRFGSSGALLTLVLACKYFNDILKIDINKKTNKVNIVINYIVAIILSTIILAIFFLKPGDLSDIFAGQYISVIGLIIFILLITLFLLPISFLLITKSLIGKHFYNITLIVSISLCCMNFLMQMYSAPFNTAQLLTIKNSICTNITDNYRVKFTDNNYLALNAPVLNVNSINTFSSMIDEKVSLSVYPLGYPTSSNLTYSYGGTIISDMIIGNKYTISSHEINKNHLKLLATDGNYFLYENIFLKGYITSFNTVPTLSSDLIKNQQLLYESLGGENQLLRKVDYDELKITYTNCTYDKESKTFKYINPNELPTISILDTFDKNTLLYVNTKQENYTYREVEVNNNKLMCNSIIELNNSSNTFKFVEELNMSEYEFYTLDLNKIANLNYESFSLTQGKNSLTSTINLSNDSTVIIPFANIEGYTVKVNGKETEFSNKFTGLMTLDLESGENLIEIEFKNPLFEYFIKGLLIGLIFVLIGILVYRFKDGINDKFINYSFNGLSIIYLFTFYLFPIVLCLMKLFNIV